MKTKTLFLIIVLSVVLLFAFGCSSQVINDPVSPGDSSSGIELGDDDLLPELLFEEDDVEIGEMI
jgi:hypothetical protein